MKHHEA